MNKIVYRQQSNNDMLFASGIQDSYFDYKMQLYRWSGAEIVAIGSSRAMQVRGEFFDVNFANLGGAATSPDSLKAVSKAIVTLPRRPKLALVFIDYWWVNGRYLKQKPSDSLSRYPAYPDVTTLYQAANVLYDQSDRLPALFPPPSDRLGLLAILSNQGFDHFGSHYSVSEITGEKPFQDKKFSFWGQVVADETFQFVHTDQPDARALQTIVESIRILEQSGVHTIVLFPPLSQHINGLISERTKRFGYMTQLKAALKTQGIAFYDYTSLAPLQPIQTPDCEFIDGLHAGDVGYARMLLDIARRDNALKAVISKDLAAFVREHTGHAMGVTTYMRGKKEVDFLALGCKK